MATPALFKHCLTVYQAMLREAEHREGDDLVWKGHATKLIDSLDVPKGYYSPIINQLKTMGCIEQLRRGGGNPPAASVWKLIKAPAIEVFDNSKQAKSYESSFILTQRMKEHNDRLVILEGQMARVFRTLNEMQAREGIE